MSILTIRPGMNISEKFLWSLAIDSVGIISYLFPGFEVLDIVWAPLSGHLIYKIYGNKFMCNVAIGEEILPGTDFIPTALLTWLFDFLGIIKNRQGGG